MSAPGARVTVGMASRSIGVADDDDAMRDALVDALRASGYQVFSARDGRQLLRALVDRQRAGRPPVLVVSDIFMPHMTGLQALVAAREAGITVDFIMMSTFADDDALDAARSLGAVAVFEKPFDVQALCEAIADHVGRRAVQGSAVQASGDP